MGNFREFSSTILVISRFVTRDDYDTIDVKVV